MAKKKRLPTISEQLLEAIEGSGLSVHAIAARSRIPQPVLCRFVNGTRSLSLPTVDTLAAFFKMTLTKAVKPTE